ncbi:alpha/beta fold hydrolase [Marinimicrobium sp. C2-29]|uniref:alpha/beta fold hydrolase n=1 Tax=Marinimicrobium sp. C2-29 TaxID=3139825 RepID=UPI003138BEFD
MAEEPLVTPTERRFNANGMELAAQQWGHPGQRPVMALHGWLDNSASFARLAPQLPDKHIVALDLAGHGRSGHRPGTGPYNIWEDVADVFAVADQLGWERFSLLGHSRGGIIGMLAAGTFPERIGQLAAIEALWPEKHQCEDAPRQLARSIREIQALTEKPMTLYPDIERAIKARERGLFPLSHGAARALTERGLEPVAGGYRWSSDQRLLAPSALKLTEAHFRAFLDRSTASFCMLLGREGVPKLFEHYRDALALFPERLQLELLPGGHHLHMEAQASSVATILQSFFHEPD